MKTKTVVIVAAGAAATVGIAALVRGAAQLHKDGGLNLASLMVLLPMKFPLGTTDGPRDHERNPQDYELQSVGANI